MYTRYYDGYTQRAKESCVSKDAPEEAETVEIIPTQEKSESSVASVGSSLPFNLKSDDLILIAVLLLVASEGSDDWLLPVILGYLIISNS